MIAPVFIVTLALMLALVSATASLASNVNIPESMTTKKAVPKGLQMMQERMFGASKTIPNPIMNHMMAVHGKTQAETAAASASMAPQQASADKKSLLPLLPTFEVTSDNKKSKKSASVAKKDFKSQWTVGPADDGYLIADTGDVLHYNFYPSSESCLESDLIGRMSYKSGVCVEIPFSGKSFKMFEFNYYINDKTPDAGPVYEVEYLFYDDASCSSLPPSNRIYMDTGAAVEECKAFGYYKPDDVTQFMWQDDMFGNPVEGSSKPSVLRTSNQQRHFFGQYPRPDLIFSEDVLGTPAGAFQVSTDTSIKDEIEESYTMYSIAPGTCAGSDNNEETCKEAQRQAVMAQTWANVKFSDCHLSYVDQNDRSIYTQVVCDESLGPVYKEYSDALCSQVNVDLESGLTFNSFFRGSSPFDNYRFDDGNEQRTTNVFFNTVWTCKSSSLVDISSSKESFYRIMVALIVGFVVVLPATVFAFYMINKRFGWSLGTALKRAFNIGDAGQSSDEGKSIEFTAVSTA